MKNSYIQESIKRYRSAFNMHSSKSNGEEWVGSQSGVNMEDFLTHELQTLEQRVREETMVKQAQESYSLGYAAGENETAREIIYRDLKFLSNSPDLRKFEERYSSLMKQWEKKYLTNSQEDQEDDMHCHTAHLEANQCDYHCQRSDK